MNNTKTSGTKSKVLQSNKTVVKIKPAGYSSSQGGSYGPIGFDPLNYKVSNPSGVQMVGGAGGLYRVGSMTGTGHKMNGYGLGAEIVGSVGGVLGGLAGTYISGANPFVIAGASTAVGGVFKSIAEQIGLGIIPQFYIDFVDRLIGNQKTLSEIKSAIMKFELSSELKTRLSKAVSSLLKSMSGGAGSNKKSNRKVKRRMIKGSGGVFQPNTSDFGLVKF